MYRPWYTKVNWTVLAVVFFLTVLGMLTIYSATFREEHFADVKRQLLALAIGLALAVPFFFIDYKKICTFRLPFPSAPVGIKLSYLFYLAAVLLLVLVMKRGHTALGAQRWIGLGPLGSFQPSEIAKLAVLMALATFLSEQEKPLSWKSILTAGLLAGIPILLVLKQPDLGTSIILSVILASLFLLLGFNPVLLVAGIGVAAPFAFRILKEYQRKRLLVFLHPEQDPRGDGWNIIQSLIAVGSGKLTGKGLLAGTQTQLKFVPEHSTDFIFTVIGEELGFIGAVFVLVLYFLLLWSASRTLLETEDLLGRLLACGIVTMLFFHVLINVGMTMGVMPITGIPLPFISYGGSSLITNLLAVTLLLNIEFRRDRILAD